MRYEKRYFLLSCMISYLQVVAMTEEKRIENILKAYSQSACTVNQLFEDPCCKKSLRSLLSLAVKYEKREMARELLEKGADPFLYDGIATPVDETLDLEVVKLLVEKSLLPDKHTRLFDSLIKRAALDACSREIDRKKKRVTIVTWLLREKKLIIQEAGEKTTALQKAKDQFYSIYGINQKGTDAEIENFNQCFALHQQEIELVKSNGAERPAIDTALE